MNSNICDIEQLDKALEANKDLQIEVYKKRELVSTLETKKLKNEFKDTCKDFLRYNKEFNEFLL